MKVLLINPLRENEISGSLPDVVTEERGYSPPLGLLYIAGYLKKHTNHDITIIDSQVEKLDYNSLASRIAAVEPNIVGITTMTVTLVDVIKTINIVKRINKNIKIVLGGPHVHLFPEETIKLQNVDFLVMGEGEETFKELLDFIGDKSKLSKVPGLVFMDGEEIINTGMRPYIRDIDKLPFPARTMVLYKKYTSLLTKSNNVVTTIFTSRGCPYHCYFCDRLHLGKIFRPRSPKNVVDELQECVEMGIRDFLFYDDTFTVEKKRVIDICNEIIRRNLNIRWDIRTRIDTVNEEIISCLKKAGCHGIHYGVESGTEKILKILNKNINIAQIKQVVQLTRKYKIPILAYFMIGNPTETIDDIYATFKFMKRLNPDYVHLTIYTPFPGTKIYLKGLKDGDFKSDYWKIFAKNPMADFVLPYWDKIFSRDKLNSLLIKGYKDFYMRPSYIIKSFRKLSSFKEFKKKVVAGFKVLIMNNK